MDFQHIACRVAFRSSAQGEIELSAALPRVFVRGNFSIYFTEIGFDFGQGWSIVSDTKAKAGPAIRFFGNSLSARVSGLARVSRMDRPHLSRRRWQTQLSGKVASHACSSFFAHCTVRTLVCPLPGVSLKASECESSP